MSLVMTGAVRATIPASDRSGFWVSE